MHSNARALWGTGVACLARRQYPRSCSTARATLCAAAVGRGRSSPAGGGASGRAESSGKEAMQFAGAQAPQSQLPQTMTCQVCFGRGHERCLVCDVEPRSSCRWCEGWGFRLCDQCGGSGKLSGSKAVDAAGTIAVDASGPFSLVRNYSRMRPLQDMKASLRSLDSFDDDEDSFDEDEWRDLQLSEHADERAKRRTDGKWVKGPMSAIHREKIRAAMKGRGKGVPKTEAHKRKIARSMQRSLATVEHREKIAVANKGQRKTCRVCGELGHNSRTCPLTGYVARSAQKGLDGESRRVQRRCGACGGLGHNVRTCSNSDPGIAERVRTWKSRA